MRQTLTISDDLYAKLAKLAKQQGFESIEMLLEKWYSREVSLQQRAEAMRHLTEVHETLQATKGNMRNSVDLLRESSNP